jgi:hypothetical protein
MFSLELDSCYYLLCSVLYPIWFCFFMMIKMIFFSTVTEINLSSSFRSDAQKPE